MHTMHPLRTPPGPRPVPWTRRPTWPDQVTASSQGRPAAWRSSGPQPRSVAKRVLPSCRANRRRRGSGTLRPCSALSGRDGWRTNPRTAALRHLGGPVFTATFLAEGAARDGYRPLRHPVSSLALGPRGWVQTANFAVAGILCLAGAPGLRRAADRLAGCRAGPVMVATAAAGLIGSVVFHTDPVGGYPPGTPDMPARFSRAGIAHNLTAILVLARLPAAAASYGRRSWRARPAARLRDLLRGDRGATVPVTMALAGSGFGQSSRPDCLFGAPAARGLAGPAHPSAIAARTDVGKLARGSAFLQGARPRT